jgi:hypothetical protein
MVGGIALFVIRRTRAFHFGVVTYKLQCCKGGHRLCNGMVIEKHKKENQEKKTLM